MTWRLVYHTQRKVADIVELKKNELLLSLSLISSSREALIILIFQAVNLHTNLGRDVFCHQPRRRITKVEWDGTPLTEHPVNSRESVP